MRTSNSSVVVVLVVLLLALGYAFFITRPSDDDIAAKVTELAGSTAKIDTEILDSPELTTLGELRVFGERPIDPERQVLSRKNPFEGF